MQFMPLHEAWINPPRSLETCPRSSNKIVAARYATSAGVTTVITQSSKSGNDPAIVDEDQDSSLCHLRRRHNSDNTVLKARKQSRDHLHACFRIAVYALRGPLIRDGNGKVGATQSGLNEVGRALLNYSVAEIRASFDTFDTLHPVVQKYPHQAAGKTMRQFEFRNGAVSPALPQSYGTLINCDQNTKIALQDTVERIIVPADSGERRSKADQALYMIRGDSEVVCGGKLRHEVLHTTTACHHPTPVAFPKMAPTHTSGRKPHSLLQSHGANFSSSFQSRTSAAAKQTET
ncbi:hypothetical protein BU16DRAFT_554128 [Lophium mytilinum]|uniref:Uncharacterized protein n=1 Tax=Lophium mytilinum TaxID=390894 RepID=A0A6A6RE94_9PEZI|nr:hypothetical protein BU16DRAFT_554128 [Lophium mytilinum]